jgi:hypothetical protein
VLRQLKLAWHNLQSVKTVCTTMIDEWQSPEDAPAEQQHMIRAAIVPTGSHLPQRAWIIPGQHSRRQWPDL